MKHRVYSSDHFIQCPTGIYSMLLFTLNVKEYSKKKNSNIKTFKKKKFSLSEYYIVVVAIQVDEQFKKSRRK